MNRFDCLSLECPVLGPHLLEASAGTGKTFAIEHVFVRLILEKIPLEEILAVTFTKAAARELKERIFLNLKKAHTSLHENSPIWPYLAPWIGQPEAQRLLSSAINGFDRCQIFTIHGFCLRMLKEFAFEVGNLFSLQDLEAIEQSKKLKSSLARFWKEGIPEGLLCPEQIATLFGKYDTMQELGSAILNSKKRLTSRSFQELFHEFSSFSIPENLPEEFEKIRIQYKAHPGDFDAQINLLDLPQNPLSFRKLIQHQGSLFSFLSPKNRKVKYLGPTPLDEMTFQLGSLVFEATHPKKILSLLASSWDTWEKTQEPIFHPDALLSHMRQAIDTPSFVLQLQKRFKAVIIDEFQDTDALQWDIFNEAFLKSPHLKALYLVGDPKQSIYRFRNADVYTYFKAKEALKPHLYHLDTNFRSSKELIQSLNRLFARNWLFLPQINGSIDSHPVYAGSDQTSDFQDEKKALHWMRGEEETFLPYSVCEIEKLFPKYSIAVLVKDRYEIQEAMTLLRQRNIPCIARSHEPLSETFTFQCVKELLNAIAFPQDESCRSIVEAGPFSNVRFLKATLEERGLAYFFSQVSLIQEMEDGAQMIEALLDWERSQGFSFDGLIRFLDEFDEEIRKRMDEMEEAVQILTLHMSKGLEFDVVFALALASGAPLAEDAEEDAEKLRQLYVAMTRAKKRLYVPLKNTTRRISPMDLFREIVEKEEGPFPMFIESLPESSSEIIPSPFFLPPPTRCPPQIIPPAPLKQASPYLPSQIYSFTSLAKTKEMEFIQTPEEGPHFLPRGKETGTLIHSVFEALFRSPQRDFSLIEKQLLHTPLAPWISLVESLVQNTMNIPLSDGTCTFCLKDISEVCVEMEFLYPKETQFIKGFIDLVFIHHKKIYIVDWKTNLLKDDSKEAVDEAMKGHDYELQASLYTEALRRHFGDSFDLMFGGAFYLFIRTGTYTHFIPRKI